ncbi:uncharacterized protein LOC115076278 isoform X2 [Rhinatrema bivittatum]|uniref:uncharacterized protein LOC115076278 isoform X2 n=1 Tax=Rhinatrema bivittatum TaxID=194408 RepID=UPI001125E192|nr:uncharacterized protein LOC115076278 isoform X2 [Rhinatrema bivittatum]
MAQHDKKPTLLEEPRRPSVFDVFSLTVTDELFRGTISEKPEEELKETEEREVEKGSPEVPAAEYLSETPVNIPALGNLPKRDVSSLEGLSQEEDASLTCFFRRFYIVLANVAVVLVVSAAALSICLILRYGHNSSSERACPDYVELCMPVDNCSLTGGINSCSSAKQQANISHISTTDYRNPVVLLGRSSLLQVYNVSEGRYYTICHKGWDPIFGRMTCRELGFNSHADSEAVDLRLSEPSCLDSFAIVTKVEEHADHIENFLMPVLWPSCHHSPAHCWRVPIGRGHLAMAGEPAMGEETHLWRIHHFLSVGPQRSPLLCAVQSVDSQ